jgi:hypothetical protein
MRRLFKNGLFYSIGYIGGVIITAAAFIAAIGLLIMAVKFLIGVL